MTDTTHHYYFVPDGVLDLDAIKAQAYKASVDTRSPNRSVIHMHKHGTSCANVVHIDYPIGGPDGKADPAGDS